jgi:hypothetical protein
VCTCLDPGTHGDLCKSPDRTKDQGIGEVFSRKISVHIGCLMGKGLKIG